jgi:hypothetical protein
MFLNVLDTGTGDFWTGKVVNRDSWFRTKLNHVGAKLLIFGSGAVSYSKSTVCVTKLLFKSNIK